jgi:hypothetical protein
MIYSKPELKAFCKFIRNTQSFQREVSAYVSLFKHEQYSPKEVLSCCAQSIKDWTFIYTTKHVIGCIYSSDLEKLSLNLYNFICKKANLPPRYNK